MNPRIQPASLKWDEMGTPISTQFDDPYFSKEDGLAESIYVFLQANKLAERFASLPENGSFVIAETGFGTGLNFLLSWRCFLQNAPKSATLRYISVEGFPLRIEDLRKSLNQWPELKGFSEQLTHHYPVLVPGHHWRCFPTGDERNGRIGLQLIFDQLEPALKSLHPKITHHNFDQAIPAVDAWFLDGFAPAKNPEMWEQIIYPSIARLSKDNTSLASFTAAGSVRRSLAEWGFEVEKVGGFGRKREMITANFAPDWQPEKEQIRAHADKSAQTWHLPPQTSLLDQKQDKPQKISIIGAGIAGLCLAKSLAERGIEVTIYDRHKDPAQAASGNAQVAIFGRLSPDQGDLEDFVMHSLSYAADFYKPYWQKVGDNCGLLQLARNEKEKQRMQLLVELLPNNNGLVEYLESAQSAEYCGLQLKEDGLWFPNSGWISPPKLAQEILQHPLIRFKGGLELSVREEFGKWLITDQDQDFQESCESLVICTGAEVLNAGQFDWLPIKPVAGQVELVTTNESTQALKAIISQTTSICPSNEGVHCLGGSYRLGETSLENRKTDFESNINKINSMLDISNNSDEIKNSDLTRSRVSVRATTPDYLPICGAAPGIEQLNVDFEPLSRDAKTPINKTAPSQKGLFLNLGFGSRGYAYAPLCAEHLASIICDDRSPLPNHLQRAIHPARFPIRNIIRGKN